MSHSLLNKIALGFALLVVTFVWVVCLVLMWMLTRLYLEALTSIVDLAQLS